MGNAGSGNFTGRGLLPDGGNRVTRKGKGIYQVGEKGERKGREEKKRRERKGKGEWINIKKEGWIKQ